MELLLIILVAAILGVAAQLGASTRPMAPRSAPPGSPGRYLPLAQSRRALPVTRSDRLRSRRIGAFTVSGLVSSETTLPVLATGSRAPRAPPRGREELDRSRLARHQQNPAATAKGTPVKVSTWTTTHHIGGRLRSASTMLAGYRPEQARRRGLPVTACLVTAFGEPLSRRNKSARGTNHGLTIRVGSDAI